MGVLTDRITKELCGKNYQYHDRLTINYKTKPPNSLSHMQAYDIENPYLYALFMLRKKEYYVMGKSPRVAELYHITNSRSEDSILRTNLDWRFCIRQRYGPGVCFSRDIEYSVLHSKVTKPFICLEFLVLIGKEVTRHALYSDSIADDTGRSPNGKVYVKAREDEFYPFVLYK